MKILASGSSRDAQYREYLTNHITNVNNVWYEVLRPRLQGDLDESELFAIDDAIDQHDQSKYGPEEWEGYLNYFYPVEDGLQDQDALDREFKYAWNHHCNHNPHHCEYWVLLNTDDKGIPEPLDMPVAEVLHMLCDWASFRYDPDNTAGREGDAKTTREWWESARDSHPMTDETIELVEMYIDLLP